jgi:ERCC4-type nuclease
MASRVTILVDHGERPSGVPAHLRCLGIDVRYASLAAGDYLTGTSTAVERKTVADLHRAIATGRLWRQIGALRSAFAARYLLVEGTTVYHGAIHQAGVRGALLAVVEGDVRLVWTRGPRDTAEWLHAIAVRGARGLAQPRPRSRPVRTPASLLASIPGVSQVAATELIRRFGSVAGVAQADDKDLLAVRGLGPSRVATIRSLLA